MAIRFVLTLFVVGLTATVVWTAEPDVQKAEQAVVDKLKELKVEGSKPVLVKDEVVSRALPGQVVFALVFPQYPVARVPQPPLGAQNLFAVGADGKVNLVTNRGALEDLFKKSAAPVKDEKA